MGGLEREHGECQRNGKRCKRCCFREMNQLTMINSWENGTMGSNNIGDMYKERGFPPSKCLKKNS